ncbi:uncharacterized protein [Eucyclogobius newberryi]|uniref:uncharacterized protein n=1 Tax=Eucyclogobius newberryi TaxID=166745 RepID=UPI003B5976FC
MECQNIFPTMPPSEIPSDPDEPFFILSLTEIPVCPSGDLVGSGSSLPVTEAQQRNPVEPAEPLAAGIDISLSNIHIPTPEKAALGSGLICVEEYLPSAPSVDISILAETPEKPSVRRLTLPEAQGNSSKADSLSTGSQTPVRGAVDTKTSSRRQNVSCKAVAEEANWQDHTKASAHAESCREMVEHMDSKSQEESDGSSVTKKITKKSAETRMNQPQHRKTKATCGPLWEQTEIQYFGSPTSKIKNLFTCLSEPSKSQQSDSTNMEEEPTNISDFRTNITEETLKEIPGDGACHDKTQRKPAATMATIGKQRKTNTSMKLPREQKKIPTEKQLTEVSVNEATSSFILQENLAAFSAPVRSIDSSQQDHKKANKKGNANRKNKGLNEAKHLKESTSSSGTGPGPTHESNPQSCLQSTSGPRVSRQSDSIESCSKKEEPTDVSQYFISDVFTEVESDDRVTGTSNNTARSDKSQTAETIRNKGQNIKVNASYDSSSGQRSSLNEEQPAEVSVTNEATSSSSSVKTPPTTSVTETTSGPSQTDAKTTRGKGSSNTKNKAICKSLKSQKKCKEASRFPEAVSPDSLKETQSRSSRRLRGGSEFPVFKDDSSGSNEEPTHVSQCLAGDAFTKAESGTCKVARKPIKDDVCTEKTQTSETRMKTREKRKTKASSGPLCSQRNPLTEEHPSETSIANKTQKTVKSAELNQPVTEKMKGKEQSNRNKKASSGAEARGSRPQTALKSPETLPMERIKESPLGKPQLPGLQSDPKGSSDDEPTNVSQYFLSDVFTEVDEEFKS